MNMVGHPKHVEKALEAGAEGEAAAEEYVHSITIFFTIFQFFVVTYTFIYEYSKWIFNHQKYPNTRTARIEQLLISMFKT